MSPILLATRTALAILLIARDPGDPAAAPPVEVRAVPWERGLPSPRIPASMRAAIEPRSAGADLPGGVRLRFWPAKRIRVDPRIERAPGGLDRVHVHSPFASGAFAGVLRIEGGEDGWIDAKGQRVGPGTYAAVYAVQPILKEHRGTRPWRDVLLLVHPREARLPLDEPSHAADASRRVSGSGHPAVLSLPPPGNRAVPSLPCLLLGPGGRVVLELRIQDRAVALELSVGPSRPADGAI